MKRYVIKHKEYNTYLQDIKEINNQYIFIFTDTKRNARTYSNYQALGTKKCFNKLNNECEVVSL